jgi:hypothetical protein
MGYGFVYVLANAAMPGIYKVGFTERSPSLRCRELSQSTSIPVDFELICYAEYENAHEREQEIHSMLADLRLSRGREFFRGDLKVITDLVVDREESLSFFDDNLPPQLYLYSPMYRHEVDPEQFPIPADQAPREVVGFE